MRNLLNYLLLLLPILYIVMVMIIYLKQRELLYHPGRNSHELDYYNLKGAKEISLVTKDNIKIQAWYKEPLAQGFMTIFFPGNAGSLEDRVDKLRILDELGDGYLIISWRGFGKSQGIPNKLGLINDAESAVNFVLEKGYDLKKIIIIGESLGTGIAVEMAIKHHFKGLFLITPYTSIADRAGELYPFLPTQLLTKDNFKVLDNIDKINQPLLIMHGTADKVVPYSHSQKIFAKAKDPKDFITYIDAGHNDYDARDAFAKMQNYFKELEPNYYGQ